MNRKNWKPNEHSWICSSHFVGGKKLNDPTSLAYNPFIFSHVKSPKKRKAEDLHRFAGLRESKRRTEAFQRERLEAKQRHREREMQLKREKE